MVKEEQELCELLSSYWQEGNDYVAGGYVHGILIGAAFYKPLRETIKFLTYIYIKKEE